MKSRNTFRKFKKFLGANKPADINKLRKAKNKKDKKHAPNSYNIVLSMEGYRAQYWNLAVTSELLADQELASLQAGQINYD